MNRMTRNLTLLFLTGLLVLVSVPTWAQETGGGAGPMIEPTQEAAAAPEITTDMALNTLWVLVAGFLVFFMNAGFGCLEAGFCRAKNTVNILGKNFVVFGISSLVFWAVGFAIMFGDGSSFMGQTGWLLEGADNSPALDGEGYEGDYGSIAWTDIPLYAKFFFQLAFAATAATIVSGCVAERIHYRAYMIFVLFLVGFSYAVSGHWIWGGGWLGQMGLIDFAGGTVVHITAGVAALVLALMIGQRKDFLQSASLPHNLTMSFTGAAMLWVGWFGFNAGSQLAADGVAGMALFVTHISAATGALSWMVIEWIKFGKPSGLGAITGMVAGLATITPASGSVGPAGALLVGLAGGVICYFATTYLKQRMKIDDSLDVFPVHGVGGMVGTFLAGILVSANLGIFSGNGLAEGMTIGSQTGVQIVGILATGTYTAIVTFVLVKVVGAITSGIRVTDEQEQMGCDITDHDEKGYSM